MQFRYIVDVEIKNDALTQENDNNDLAVMLLENLQANQLGSLPWVLISQYTLMEVWLSDA